MNTRLIRTYLTLALLCFTLWPLGGLAQHQSTKQTPQSTPSQMLTEAAHAFSAKDYSKAARIYNDALDALQKAQEFDQTDPTNLSDVYYNLGNCYFRLKDFPHAVLNYQRALRHNPANTDAAFNLELTQSKLQDRFDTPTEMFFISWTRQLISSHGATDWGHWALGSLAATLILALVYLFASHVNWRKTGFFASLLCLLVTVISTLFAFLQQKAYDCNDPIVVMQAVQTFSSPSVTSQKVRMLNEGTTLRRLDTSGKSWILIEMPDGKQAWINGNGIESVRPDQNK